YRNKSHETAAIIGCAWDKKGGKFLRHFLPSIMGYERKYTIDLNVQLQRYFEFVANVWLSFAPDDFKEKFPHDFKFAVTVPNSFIGELPPGLEGAPHLEVSIEAYEKKDGREHGNQREGEQP